MAAVGEFTKEVVGANPWSLRFLASDFTEWQ